MKLKRREMLLGAAALTPLRVEAQTAAPVELIEEARRLMKANREAIAKVAVTTDVEPAFLFKV